MDELVAERGDAGLELVVALSIPLCAVGAGDSIGAGEGNVHDVVLIVARVAVDALAVAGRGERDGGLADHGVVAVIAVHVSPDTVDLPSLLVSTTARW